MTQQTIGHYEIRDELGEGGMGTVYLAYDPKLEREVALKVLQPQLFMHDPEYAARFEREVKTIAALQHGSIVSLYEYGQDGEWLYFVMPYMRGGTLRDRLQKGPLPLEDTNKIMQRIGSALAKAHRQGVIHRDLKPGNILFDEDGEAYLSDFGIVKVEDPAGLKTQTGQSLGTPQYMSPEQLDGKEIDGRSDIYSLGIILYEMVTGSKPYDSESTARIIIMQITAPVPDILVDNPDLPPGLQKIIATAMAKEPADRYVQVNQLTKALDEVVNTQNAAITQTPVSQAGSESNLVKSAMVESESDFRAKANSKTIQPSKTAPSQERPKTKRLSYSRAVLNHLLFGRGLFYVNNHASRRFLYVAAFFVMIIGLGNDLLDFDYQFLGSDIVPDGTTGIFGLIALLIYLAGFVDTLLECRKQNRLVY